MKGQFTLHTNAQTHYHAGFSFVKNAQPDILHPKEITHFNSLTNENRKHSYSLGRQAAKQALSALLNTEKDEKSFHIDFGIFRQPVVKHETYHNLNVSITHTKEYAAALAFPEEIPMAIDLEKLGAQREETLRQWTTESEQATFEQATFEQAAFGQVPTGQEKDLTVIWTSKEALSKILRTGLDIDFQLLELDQTTTNGPTIISTFKHFPQYQSLSQIKGDLVCSIVLPNSTTADLSTFWSGFGDLTK